MAMENTQVLADFGGFPYIYWDFSSAMLDYQRVTIVVARGYQHQPPLTSIDQNYNR